MFLNNQGPVVQSIVSLTRSLRVILLTVVANSIYNILIFFAEKMWVATHIFFSIKIQHICVSLYINFNELLTNDIVSFEQLGPDLYWSFFLITWIVSYLCILDVLSATKTGETKKNLAPNKRFFIP